MIQHLRPALVMIALFTLVTGLAYPFAITGLAQLALPAQANGSQSMVSGRVVGSRLIGQSFARAEYLHPRPSAAGNGYDPTASSGSNYGPLDPKLADRIKGDVASIQKDAPGVVIPADAVTASGSGLDPDISPEYAALQAPRIASSRHAALDDVRAVITAEIRGRTLGVIGEPRVNVLAVNEALDARFKGGAPSR